MSDQRRTYIRKRSFTIVGAGPQGPAGVMSGPVLHALTGKTTPVDADEVVISDSAASWVAKKLTFANFKAWVLSFLGNSATKAVGTTAGTVAAGDHGHTGVYAARREIKTSAFTAAVYGRYEANFTGPVADPASAALNESYEVLVTGGVVTIGSTAYAPGQMPITRVCTNATGPVFTTLLTQFTDALRLDAGLSTSGVFTFSTGTTFGAYGTGVAALHRTALELGSAALSATTDFAASAKFIAGAGALTGPAAPLTIGTAAASAVGDFAAASHTQAVASISDSGAAGRALVQADTPAAADAVTERYLSALASPATSSSLTYASTGASIALGVGTWKVVVQCFYTNAASSSTQFRLNAGANWSETDTNKIGTGIVNTTLGAPTFATGGTALLAVTSAVAQGTVSAWVVVKLTGSATLTLEFANTAATGTSTVTLPTHLTAKKIS
jgi:hypothetical protein